MEGVDIISEDTRYSWLGAKVVSSLKIKKEAFQQFLAAESRYCFFLQAGGDFESLKKESYFKDAPD